MRGEERKHVEIIVITKCLRKSKQWTFWEQQIQVYKRVLLTDVCFSVNGVNNSRVQQNVDFVADWQNGHKKQEVTQMWQCGFVLFGLKGQFKQFETTNFFTSLEIEAHIVIKFGFNTLLTRRAVLGRTATSTEMKTEPDPDRVALQLMQSQKGSMRSFAKTEEGEGEVVGWQGHTYPCV